jgi:ribosomal protein S27AE
MLDKKKVIELLSYDVEAAMKFNFDLMSHPPIQAYLDWRDVESLRNIATSIRYNANLDKKLEAIRSIMTGRGFIKFHSGTNRIVYRYREDDGFLLKIALDRVGMQDNPMEFDNQRLLKPFVAKMYDRTQCGTIGLVEKVKPILSRKEFMSVADDAFSLITHFIGKYVLADIGTNYFMNYGVRNGIGLVLLDYPYLYELDGDKLTCNNFIRDKNKYCLGNLDYDVGFNDIVCEKCGKVYYAKELKRQVSGGAVLVSDRENSSRVKISLRRGDEVLKSTTIRKESRILK